MNSVADIEKLLNPVLNEEKMELVDIQYVREHGKMVLRLFIDKDGGMRLDDCEHMSDKVGTLLDNSGVLSDSYILEISSPGLDRVLKKEKDFIKFIGKKAKVTLHEPMDGQRNFKGEILSAGNGQIKISDVTGKTVDIFIEKISKARLEPDI
ncbi:MAG: ribosome maturation factor RimP [Endomicrobiales bacterium]|nr:ribosome maturation factor RimP [Endomicrobiales bacterium]